MADQKSVDEWIITEFMHRFKKFVCRINQKDNVNNKYNFHWGLPFSYNIVSWNKDTEKKDIDWDSYCDDTIYMENFESNEKNLIKALKKVFEKHLKEQNIKIVRGKNAFGEKYFELEITPYEPFVM